MLALVSGLLPRSPDSSPTIQAVGYREEQPIARGEGSGAALPPGRLLASHAIRALSSLLSWGPEKTPPEDTAVTGCGSPICQG